MPTNTPILKWDDYFLSLCRTVSLKSKDTSTKCGAVIVDVNNRVLGMGFNGPPRQINDDEVPWEERDTTKSNKYDFIMHAEENAIYDALSKTNSDKLANTTLYCTHRPCIECTKRCIAVGLKEVCWPESAPDYVSGRGTEERIIALIRSQKLVSGATKFYILKGV